MQKFTFAYRKDKDNEIDTLLLQHLSKIIKIILSLINISEENLAECEDLTRQIS